MAVAALVNIQIKKQMRRRWAFRITPRIANRLTANCKIWSINKINRLPKIGSVGVGVNLGRADVGMAQKNLGNAQVGAA